MVLIEKGKLVRVKKCGQHTINNVPFCKKKSVDCL